MHKPETPAEALRNLSRMAADGFTDWPSLGHITAARCNEHGGGQYHRCPPLQK
jgi:hypothetical protein